MTWLNWFVQFWQRKQLHTSHLKVHSTRRRRGQFAQELSPAIDSESCPQHPHRGSFWPDRILLRVDSGSAGPTGFCEVRSVPLEVLETAHGSKPALDFDPQVVVDVVLLEVGTDSPHHSQSNPENNKCEPHDLKLVSRLFARTYFEDYPTSETLPSPEGVLRLAYRDDLQVRGYRSGIVVCWTSKTPTVQCNYRLATRAALKGLIRECGRI